MKKREGNEGRQKHYAGDCFRSANDNFHKEEEEDKNKKKDEDKNEALEGLTLFLILVDVNGFDNEGFHYIARAWFFFSK